MPTLRSGAWLTEKTFCHVEVGCSSSASPACIPWEGTAYTVWEHTDCNYPTPAGNFILEYYDVNSKTWVYITETNPGRYVGFVWTSWNFSNTGWDQGGRFRNKFGGLVSEFTIAAKPCTPSWQIAEWSKCQPDGMQIRTVTDSNNCGDNTNKPIESQICTYVPPSTILHITSVPSGALVYIDGIEKGITPTTLTGLSIGMHEVKFSKVEYNDSIVNIDLLDNETSTVWSTLVSLCESNWQIGEWSECQPDYTQIRTVTDLNNCGNGIDKPSEMQSCVYIPPYGDLDALSYYPTRGNDEVINELGHYAAHYCDYCTRFEPAIGWEVIKCDTISGIGSHGCCSNCVVIYVELKQITLPCIPNWQCNQPLDKNMSDGCGNTQSNSECTTIVESIDTTLSDSNKLIVPIILGTIGLGTILKIFKK